MGIPTHRGFRPASGVCVGVRRIWTARCAAEHTRPSTRAATLRAARAISLEHGVSVAVYRSGVYELSVYVYSGTPRLQVPFGRRS